MKVRAGKNAKLAVVALLAVAAGLMATHRAAYNEEAKVDTSRDRIEIIELLNRHQIYIDLKDADRYASLYAPDGRYESPFGSAIGREKIAAMSRHFGAMDADFFKNKRHYGGPAMIDIDGDKATVLSHYWVADFTDSKWSVFATGTYRDELRKINGQWKIANRVQAIDTPEPAKK